jgi:hypothetical protein
MRFHRPTPRGPRSVILGVLAALLLLTSFAGVAFAHGGRDDTRRALSGTVASIAAPQFTVSTRSGRTVTIATDANTVFKKKVRTPETSDAERATRMELTNLSGLSVGDRVKVVGTRDGGTLVARRVRILGSEPKAAATAATTTTAAPASTASAPAEKEHTKSAGQPVVLASHETRKPGAGDDAHVFGRVVSVGAPSFMVETPKGKLTVTTSGSTTFSKAVVAKSGDSHPKVSLVSSSLGDLIPGAFVKVVGTRNADNTIAAARVFVLDASTKSGFEKSGFEGRRHDEARDGSGHRTDGDHRRLDGRRHDDASAHR